MKRLLVFLGCILLLTFSFLLGATPTQAKWWQIFHRHNKEDSAEVQQIPPPAPTVRTPYSSGTVSTPATTGSGFAPIPGNTSSNGGNGVSSPVQIVSPSLEPPPLPVRPPIPDPPPISCPAPLGSGIAKPALAWRAKSVRQLSEGRSLAAATQLATTVPIAAAPTVAASTVRVADRDFCLSKTFAAKFDDTFMAAVLALSQSGLSIRSMDSSRGKLEAVLLDPRLRTSVSLQLDRDLLDTTKVSCRYVSEGTAGRVLLANVLSNINICLGRQNTGTAVRASVLQVGAPVASRAASTSAINAEQLK